MPLTVGGGVRSIDDIPQRLLLAGADKVGGQHRGCERRRTLSANAAANRFGAQCVVVAIDAKSSRATVAGRFSPMADATPTGIDAVAFAKDMVGSRGW